MTLFVISVAAVLLMSALCSMSESAIYAVRMTYVMTLANTGSLAGRILLGFKENMERPISAILIINTAANTAGAAIAGHQAQQLFGETAVGWFAAAFTVAVLVFSEILPKLIGVVYCRTIAPTVSLVWVVAIRVLYPVIWLVERLTERIQPEAPVLAAPEEEVEQLAMISAKEGSILPLEARLVQNALRLDDVKAADILTPRSVVFKLPANATIGEVRDTVKQLKQSRIPVYEGDDPENWIGLVLTRDMLVAMAQNQPDRKLRTLMRPLSFVPETAKGHDLLGEFLKRRSHLFGVLDEYGGIEGVVTLEDVLESIIGEEIVDECDTAADLQEDARRRNLSQLEQDENRSP
jgi:CBS domain containing-hemolysin-like protein